jgi:hypothetical protein
MMRANGKAVYLRMCLADLYEEVEQVVPDGSVGKQTAKSAISDAIDALDRGISALRSFDASDEKGS